MPEIAMLIGGAGTGKTSRLLDIMSQIIKRGIEPNQIGFVSFTRAARAEAASRAADQFKIPVTELEQQGWFRTLHSVCYRCLGGQKGELLTGKAADKAWLQDAIQQPVSGAGASGDDDGFADLVFEGQTEADVALKLWGAARNRLCPFSEVWEAAVRVDDRTPDLTFCEDVIRQYEMAKQASGRCDFVDLLCRFAGWRCTAYGAEEVQPRGEAPRLPVWFLDEWQDSSALLGSVGNRLMETAQWVYAVGDPFQNVYRWSGSDSKHFLSLPAAKKDVLRKSFRCPRCVLDLGEAILRQCSDYWDRGIEPSDHDGVIHRGTIDDAIAEIDPRERWLILARTNREVSVTLGTKLNNAGIPWRPTKGNGGWAAPVRNAALRALTDLQNGDPIDGDMWKKVLKVLPAKDLLERGTKAKFESADYPAAENHPFVLPHDLAELGATPLLMDLIRTGRWADLVEDGERWQTAVQRWGAEAVEQLNVQAGTVHSVKGAEGENVILLTTTTQQVERSQETQEGYDEERRVEYVAVTRAKRRLFIADDPRAYRRMEIPA